MSNKLENLTFSELEEKIYKLVCELGCEIIKQILENKDRELMITRNKKEYRHKGYRTNTIKTVMGEIEYTRAIYLKDNKYMYLLDKTVSIDTIGKISTNLVEIMLKTVVNTVSYRKGATEIQNTTNETISHQTLNDIVWKVGKIIEDRENKEIQLMKKEKLVKGTRIVPALFEESDGIWFNLQGKDREQAKEEYKKQCEKKKQEYNPFHKHKTELKLHVTYEGWQKNGNRYSLVNKQYIAGMMTVDRLKKLRNARVYQMYDEEKIKLRASNGDGARWINSIVTNDTIQQKDLFHIQQEIIRDIKEEEYRKEIQKIIEERRYNEIPMYIDSLKYVLGGEERVCKKLDKLKSYLKDGLPRYREILEKQGKTMPEPPKGIEYKDMGTMESQIFTVLCVRLCSGRKAFLKLGANYLAKICAEYFENSGDITLKEMNKTIPVDNSIEEWINEIEENVKKHKKMHRADRNEIEEYKYNCGTVVGINEKYQELLKLAEPTALIYR